MKTKIEVLQLILERFIESSDNHITIVEGLCIHAIKLYYMNKLSFEEAKWFYDLIDNAYDVDIPYATYKWSVLKCEGAVDKRVSWMKKYIEVYKEQTIKYKLWHLLKLNSKEK